MQFNFKTSPWFEIGVIEEVNSLDKSIWGCRYLCTRTKLRVFRALLQFYSVVVKHGRCQVLSSLASKPSNRSLCRTMWYSWRDYGANHGYTLRLAQDPVLAKSGTASSDYTGTWLASHRTILPPRLSLRDIPGWRGPVRRPRV